jgi:hypothetical protein
MTISNLAYFSVPLSTDQSSQSQGLLMPKLKYRFRVTLDGFGVAGTPSTELTKQVMNVTRPVAQFEEIKLAVYNSTVKLAGKHSWNDATLTLRDDITGAVTGKVGEQMQKQFDFFEQSSAASGIDYKFLMRVELLDGGNGAYTPTVLEAFEFHGCWIKQVTYQGGDYASATDPMDIALSICYDNALQLNGAGQLTGIGQSVGRTIGTMALGG